MSKKNRECVQEFLYLKPHIGLYTKQLEKKGFWLLGSLKIPEGTMSCHEHYATSLHNTQKLADNIY